MTIIYKTTLIQQSLEKMMALVEDVEHYPEFLPGCEQVVIQEKTDCMMKVEVTAGWHGFVKKFTTCNTKPRPHEIHMVLVNGPFEHLQGVWSFESVDGACRVSMQLDFKFKNFVFQKMFEQRMNVVVEKVFQAFCNVALNEATRSS